MDIDSAPDETTIRIRSIGLPAAIAGRSCETGCRPFVMWSSTEEDAGEVRVNLPGAAEPHAALEPLRGASGGPGGVPPPRAERADGIFPRYRMR